ncbi:hypothetical protein [Plantibacter flavus]|uniref:hypothetical protein n=1 Tax=Plantibacter flavus TaxID=150123 RepID=UPI001F3EEBFF|nr:hypothetical protein [Plantibacter flavus]
MALITLEQRQIKLVKNTVADGVEGAPIESGVDAKLISTDDPRARVRLVPT